MAVLLWIWQLPQNIIGLLVILFTRAKHKKSYDVWFTEKYRFGVSLGNYIIFGQFFYDVALKHEKGHQKQSLYLGWLYLIIIGLPSFIGNIIWRIKPFDYYAQPWERWADKLGGVDR